LESPTNRVLITGAEGFTGQHLRRQLEASGYQVTGLVQRDPATGQLAADLRDADKLAECITLVEPNYVVHLAGISFPGHPNATDLYEINLLGTLNLLEALTTAPCRKILLASSAVVYGDCQGSNGVLHERLTPRPGSHYACSKLAMELMARTYSEQLPVQLVRPFNYTGPGQDKKFVIPKIVDHFRRRVDYIELGNIDVERDFSDVRFVVECYQKLLEAPILHEVVNICSGRTLSISEALQTMRRISGHDIEVRQRSDLIRENEIQRIAGDNTLLTETIGPLKSISIERTLRSMYEL